MHGAVMNISARKEYWGSVVWMNNACQEVFGLESNHNLTTTPLKIPNVHTQQKNRMVGTLEMISYVT